jgi:rSAM/selenodomain-associated transferase 1
MPHLLLFGKLPRLGRVKTRLVPPLSPEQSLRLYRAFLDDQLAFVRGFTDRAHVGWWTDVQLQPAERAALSIGGIELRLQGPGDLGSRMSRAFEQSCGGDSGAAVIVGADSPTLPSTHVGEAFAALERGAPAVIAPAEDGGYVLVGLNEPRPELFQNVPWGGADVAAATRRRAAAIGIELVEISPWYDVDEMTSLRRLQDDLATPAGARRAPATARCLLDLGLPAVL